MRAVLRLDGFERYQKVFGRARFETGISESCHKLALSGDNNPTLTDVPLDHG